MAKIKANLFLKEIEKTGFTYAGKLHISAKPDYINYLLIEKELKEDMSFKELNTSPAMSKGSKALGTIWTKDSLQLEVLVWKNQLHWSLKVYLPKLNPHAGGHLEECAKFSGSIKDGLSTIQEVFGCTEYIQKQAVRIFKTSNYSNNAALGFDHYRIWCKTWYVGYAKAMLNSKPFKSWKEKQLEEGKVFFNPAEIGKKAFNEYKHTRFKGKTIRKAVPYHRDEICHPYELVADNRSQAYHKFSKKFRNSSNRAKGKAQLRHELKFDLDIFDAFYDWDEELSHLREDWFDYNDFGYWENNTPQFIKSQDEVDIYPWPDFDWDDTDPGPFEDDDVDLDQHSFAD